MAKECKCAEEIKALKAKIALLETPVLSNEQLKKGGWLGNLTWIVG